MGAGRRNQVVLATKFGSVRNERGERLGIRGDAEYVRRACDASLERLGVDQGGNFRRNLELVQRVHEIAAEKGVTPAQLALAWVLARGDDIVPIPGTRQVPYLEQNAGAVDVELDPDELARIEQAFPKGAAAGDRYLDMSPIDR